MERSKQLVSYRMARAHETLEDARILADAGRWNACVILPDSVDQTPG